MDSMRTKTRITLIFPIDGEAAGGTLFWAADHQNFYVAEIFTEGAYEVLKDDFQGRARSYCWQACCCRRDCSCCLSGCLLLLHCTTTATPGGQTQASQPSQRTLANFVKNCCPPS